MAWWSRWLSQTGQQGVLPPVGVGPDPLPVRPPPVQQGGELFDLYVAVCHYGSVSGGQYTAYAKHCQADIWNHFNDTQGS